MHHSYPLLSCQTYPWINFSQRLITHIKGSTELQDWYLNRKVEWCNHWNWTIGESISSGKLTSMITRVSCALRQKSYSISCHVFEEISCHSQFTCRLLGWLWNYSLNHSYKEIENFGIVHHFANFAVDFSEHQVSLFIQEWVMQSSFGHTFETIYKWLDFIKLSIRNLAQSPSI